VDRDEELRVLEYCYRSDRQEFVIILWMKENRGKTEFVKSLMLDL